MESTVLVKAFALLETLGAAKQPMGLAQLAQQCGLAKPTAHRVLGDLTRLGYVERVGTGIYKLSEKFYHLAAGRESALLAAAEPILVELQRRTQETVNLGVMRRDRVVYLRVLESSHPLRRVADDGSVDPVHSTALGRAILAHSDEATQQRALDAVPVEGRTPHTITDVAALRRVLQRARRDGFAEEVDENDVGVMCVAAPVFDGEDVCAAISISAPSARVDRQRRRELAEAVMSAAAGLGEQLAGARSGDSQSVSA
ncbi:MAG: IclR family transcriptional regulator [Phycisphaeraceae bacterium]